MCGIAALFSLRAGESLGYIRAMADTIRHRGPDDEGFVFFAKDGQSQAFGGTDTPEDAYHSGFRYAPTKPIDDQSTVGAFASFGHRRLSILDLSPAGHQPMCTENGRFWITYNGEIYNYRELRHELEGLGHRFVSSSDTEVILAAYTEWGKECLHRFNGMWSFVLIDAATRRIFAARDRFGVKPLYYWASPDGLLAFASEIKQFTVLPGWQPRMNGQRVYDFLNWAIQDHTRETMFQDVFQVRGGEAFEVAFDELTAQPPVYRWYVLAPRPFTGTREEAAQEFRRLLTDSVRLRLRADVDVGSCLSGGLDSSAIVCLVNDLLAEQGSTDKQKTFSACSHEKRFDEREFIDEVVNSRTIEASYVYPSMETLFDTLNDLTWHQDEPFGSTSIFAQWNVFKLASDHHVKVMLDGQGADEQLAGYHPFFAARYANLFRGLRWVRLAQEFGAAKQRHGYSPVKSAKSLVRSLLSKQGTELVWKSIRRQNFVPDWLNVEALQAKPGILTAGSPSVQDLSLDQLTATSLPVLLHWEDRDSMAHSIESRVPFLDYRLVEFVLGLPEEFKISDGITKRVLRDGMQGVLPEAIRMRMDKKGFVTPEEVWLREKQPESFRQALADAVELSGGVLKPEAMQMLERMIRGEEPFSFLPWRLISFGAWAKRFGLAPASKEKTVEAMAAKAPAHSA